ncbi:L,D-transpeptidase family protein [Terrarubrum flagellatum]|uniref:L,D-transpeptidase family protein n=1 Tax=Terrirubrum flagellatum TaxID=2895980 RepID=UPI003144D712
MAPRKFSILRVRRSIDPIHRAKAIVGGRAIPCAIGRSGMRPAALKREGDGTTPIGRFRVLTAWFRGDRWPNRSFSWATRRIGPTDGWCEDSSNRRYNHPVKVAPGANHDRLWRQDRLYDLILEIDHNARPRILGRGSAVFIHLCRLGMTPTAGCVAFEPNELRKLLPRLGRGSVIDIK